ncbi:MAG: hypothetical protein P1V51_22950 [Deltaproteobacteria bacterium]|nr:hypothetical protein [Deltaproteobacteria bacterium]
MKYWGNSVVVTLMILALLLLAAMGLRLIFPPLKKWAIPVSILAGVLGFFLGPDVAGLLPLDREVLEVIVYHGLAIMFIAISLQSPARTKGHVAGGVRSFTFGIPFMQALQTFLGLLIILSLGLALGEAVHPGIGVMLTLGFEEGPGQALALGAAWEENGMKDGAQIGLIIAALGYAWSVFLGVPLAIYGRHKGWVSKPPEVAVELEAAGEGEALEAPGALDSLTLQGVVVLGVYGITWLVCMGLSTALAGMPDIASAVWGFHFMIGAGVALGVRPLLDRLPGGTPVNDKLVTRLSGVAVDVMTCASLAAVQLAVFQANWVTVVLVTTLGGVATLIAVLYFASRAFPDAPFEHALVWFGMSTGTLAMGLALLRIVDPDLKSPAPVTTVLGSAGAIVFAAPILVAGIPMTVAAFPERYPLYGWLAMGVFLIYGLILVGVWRKFAPLRFHGKITQLWWRPAETSAEASEGSA